MEEAHHADPMFEMEEEDESQPMFRQPREATSSSNIPRDMPILWNGGVDDL